MNGQQQQQRVPVRCVGAMGRCVPGLSFTHIMKCVAMSGVLMSGGLVWCPQSYDNWRMVLLAAAAPPGGGGCYLWVDESARNVGPLLPPGPGGDAAPPSFRYVLALVRACRNSHSSSSIS